MNKWMVGVMLLAVSSMAATKLPNIVFLMADDHQSEALGCMGNPDVITPNIDRLAANGILFERCYATSPLCMASRATVMTGMYEYKTGCNFQTGLVSMEVWKNRSYPNLLRKAGYRTAFAGKWGFHVQKKWLDVSSDFDKWGGLKGGQGLYETGKNPTMVSYAKKYPHVSRALGAFGSDFIRESAESGQPFCLSLSFKAPHKPHNQIDPEDLKKYEGVTFPDPPGFGEAGLNRLPVQAKFNRQYVQRNEWDQSHYQEHQKAYYQLVSGVDAAVGMVVNALQEAGVAQNTVIVYTADNGYFCGAHGLQGKVLPYEQASRIPLIICDPRQPKKSRGQKTKAVVANIDFAPTMLDLAGLDIPTQMDGKSLVPALEKPQTRVRSQLGLVQNWGWANRDASKALAVVTEDFKYIAWCYADENVPPCEELFDLRKDPNELNDISAHPESAGMLKKMQAQYDVFQQHWAGTCVDDPIYKRMAHILDRTVPWQEKEYLMDDPKHKSKTKPLAEIYTDLTGAEYPVPGVGSTLLKKK